MGEHHLEKTLMTVYLSNDIFNCLWVYQSTTDRPLLRYPIFLQGYGLHRDYVSYRPNQSQYEAGRHLASEDQLFPDHDGLM